MNDRSTQHFSLHGHAITVRNELDTLSLGLTHAMGEFAAEPSRAMAISGSIRAYDRDEVVRHLSTTAIQASTSRDGAEIYQDGERFWLIDDRFGLVEINLLKSQWRCWVIDQPALDAQRVIDMAVLWPMAHLLRGRGLCLLPAASVMRGEVGLLLVSPLHMEGELSSLLRAGFRLVGQSWTALREADGAVEMLHMPGCVERVDPFSATRAVSQWLDLEGEFCGSAIARGVCSHVVLVEPGRRQTAAMDLIPRSSALPAMRRCWPITELHPHRVNGGQIPAKLSRCTCVLSARLSHQSSDLLDQFHRLLPAHHSIAV